MSGPYHRAGQWHEAKPTTFRDMRNEIAKRIRAKRNKISLRAWCSGCYSMTGPRGQWRFQKDLPGRNEFAKLSALQSFGAGEQLARTVMSKLHL